MQAEIDRGDCTAVVLQNDHQATLSGKVRYVEADTTFGVVAPGSAKSAVSADAIRASGKHAYDWHHFSIVYVSSVCGHLFLYFSQCSSFFWCSG